MQDFVHAQVNLHFSRVPEGVVQCLAQRDHEGLDFLSLEGGLRLGLGGSVSVRHQKVSTVVRRL